MSSKISILMAVYNAAPYLRESIESIRRQTFKEWELIAIDDASTDDSRAILSNYAEADPRIRLISLPHNGGQGKARNEGLRQAQGDYICFVDSDDCLAPDALQKIVDRFEAQPEADSVLFRHGVYAVRASIHQRYPYDTSSHAYSDDNTTRLHFLASRRVVATDADYYYRQHDQSVTHRIDGHRFDYLLANESMKRQLLSLQVDDALVSLYENERWKNLIDVSLFYYLHHRQLSGEDRARGRRILRSTWESIEVQRLSPALCRKFGYRPIRCSWTIFCWQLKAYFFLRGLLGKNKGK